MSDTARAALIYIEEGPGSGQLIPIAEGTMVIGRASVVDLRLQHPSISRRHLQMRRVRDQFFVKDLGSQNGSWVNRQRIAGETEVFHGDEIALGSAVLRIRFPKGATPRGRKPTVSQRAADPVSSAATLTTVKATHVAIIVGAVSLALVAVISAAVIGANFLRRPAAEPRRVAVTPTPKEAAPPAREARDQQIDAALQNKMAEAARAPEANDWLTPYLEGNLDAALDSAKQARASATVEKLEAFKRQYDAASRAVTAGKPDALVLLGQARAQDAALAKGKGQFAALIDGLISQQTAAAAVQTQRAEPVVTKLTTTKRAKKSPGRSASSKSSARGVSRSSARTAASQAADREFDDEPESKPAKSSKPAPKAGKNAIDDAFDE